MDSKLKVIKQLLNTGAAFTFHNFCYPDNDYPGQCAGADTSDWIEWKTRAKNVVIKSMADDSPAVMMAKQAIRIYTSGHGPDQFERAKATLLKALTNTENALREDIFGELRDEESESSSPIFSNKVFIVHGHDAELKNDVERFVHEIGLEPIVLHRQADNGDTVIEKFEKNSDVGYVFILLTPDEIAFTVDQMNVSDDLRQKEYRVRPNVIFEFGYFVGKLGRSRVCCLYKGEVTIPSDLGGLVYKKVENSIESQAYAIIKELKNAGYLVKV
ncbi:putative nucleotide-binding protein with TIR-like domain [Methylobacter tundripaludum]|uniref:Putative nucleotide-binding protein with TIR-like domain n=1 Tax=Methylobacter tundripaludum TaxID=173365 RepID=A0A2S6H7Q5_9GAMM|nr:nucleotide-binding protein [Methylobacter tundripaludum]PPK73450.1 putative nucleotide-binding protein with TIR-like domain [Methylobacter tundripaludum]